MADDGLDPVLWGDPDEAGAIRWELRNRLEHYGAATVRLDPDAPMALTFDAFVEAMDGLAAELDADTEHEDWDAPFTRVFRAPTLHARLLAAVERGSFQEVHDLVFGMKGTGMAPERLGYLEEAGGDGRTAEEVAESLADSSPDHRRILELLRSERLRMRQAE